MQSLINTWIHKLQPLAQTKWGTNSMTWKTKSILCYLTWFKICIVWFQKISIAPPWREFEILEGEKGWGGGGFKDPGNSGGVGGWMVNLVSRCPSLQNRFKYRSKCSKVLSYLLNRSFTWKNRSLNTCIWIASYLK